MRLTASISILLIIAAPCFPQEPVPTPALASLAAAERAFAKTSVEKGFRDAFLTFFADDGIFFQPHPVKAKEALRAQCARPQTVTLNWEPIFGDVSDAGDLGFTTGPYMLTDNSPQNSPPQHGCFFSIWKVQSDGSWKVVVDAGITTPGPISSSSFRAARHPRSTQEGTPSNLERERQSLMELDRELLKAVEKMGIAGAFWTFFDEEARVHRDGFLPRVGKESSRDLLAQRAFEVKWEPIASDISSSADLGYTYGRYEAAGQRESSTEQVDRGYYVRVWRRDASRRWRLLLDTISLVPPEKK